MQRLTNVDNNLTNLTSKLGILSPSDTFQRKDNSPGATQQGALNTMLNSFHVKPGKAIPDLSEQRKMQKEERMNSLLQRPAHKEAIMNGTLQEAVQDFNKVPLSMEDKGCFGNLPLINTLRQSSNTQVMGGSYVSAKKKGADDDEDKKNNRSITQCNPPTFFNEDMDKWNNKFANAIKDRERYKKQMFKTSQISCQTTNTNVMGLLTNTDKNAEGLEKEASREVQKLNKSTYMQVLKRRKSRQSCNMFSSIDFEFAGDSSKIQHLISPRRD